MAQQFKNLFPTYDPEKIGAAIRKAKKDKDVEKLLKQKIAITENSNCYICEGIFKKINDVLPLFDDKVKEYRLELEKHAIFLQAAIKEQGKLEKPKDKSV